MVVRAGLIEPWLDWAQRVILPSSLEHNTNASLFSDKH